MNTMPGSFYGTIRGQQIAGEGSSNGNTIIYGSYLDRTNEEEKEKLRMLNYTKAKASYKVTAIMQLHLLVLTLLLLVYLQDNSFLKLAIKGLLEYFLFHYNPAEQTHLLSVLLDGVDSDNAALANLERQLQVWKKLLLIQIFFVNFLIVVDHFFNKDAPPLIVPRITAPFSWSSCWSNIKDWLNLEASSRVEIYSKGNRGFQYGSVFIDFIGEIGYCSNVFILALDLLVPLIQYIMFQAIVGDSGGSRIGQTGEQAVSDVTSLIGGSEEDGYQGTVCAFTVDIYPKITIRDMMKVFYH